jgi:hypothetical protein
MSRFLILLLSLAIWIAPAQEAGESNRALFAEVAPVMRELAEITGLAQKREVSKDFISREKLKAFLESRIAETIDPEQLRVEELTLRLFGFIPEGYDLKGSTVNLLTEQAAAFYDYRKKKLFVLEGAPEYSQKFLLTHELAHALADQHFSLEKFIKKGATDDAATARMAVMEGQAQWLMIEVTSKAMGQSMRKDPGLARTMVNLSSSGLGQYPELSKAPLYIRESLLFPYTHGLLFQQAVVEKLGERAFAAVFKNPPESSRHILHPETYFAGEKGKKVKPEPALAEKEYKIAAEGEFGEFDLEMLLRQFAGEEAAREIAPAWRGGRYKALEHKKTKEARLVFGVELASAEKAGEFARIYKERVLEAKGKRSASASVLTAGALVSITEGLH